MHLFQHMRAQTVPGSPKDRVHDQRPRTDGLVEDMWGSTFRRPHGKHHWHNSLLSGYDEAVWNATF